MKIKYSLVALCCLGTALNATETTLDTITVSARNYLDTYKGYAMNMGRDVSVSLSVPF